MLAHGIDAPRLFDGMLLAPPPGTPAALRVYPTHLTVVPPGGDVFQVPFGAVESVRFDEAGWSVALEAPGGPFVFGQLARQSEPFFRAVTGAREAQARRLSEISGTDLFTDGGGVPASMLGAFDRMLESWCAPERLEGARTLLGKGDRAGSRLGLVDLLDPDENGLAAKTELPGNLAAFLLVPFDGKVVLEILSGPSAATYVFRGGVDAVNRDLQAIHFRRRPLALDPREEQVSTGRPYRLALRKLEPLMRLRAATAARVIHSGGWAAALEAVLGAAPQAARAGAS
jgi:hypothetical protein